MYAFGLVLLQVVCGVRTVTKAKEVALSMSDAMDSVDDTVLLMQHVRVKLQVASGDGDQLVTLQLHISASAPRQVLHDLAQLGAACVSIDAACRPRMGCTSAERDSIVGRLADILQSLSRETPTGDHYRA